MYVHMPMSQYVPCCSRYHRHRTSWECHQLCYQTSSGYREGILEIPSITERVKNVFIYTVCPSVKTHVSECVYSTDCISVIGIWFVLLNHLETYLLYRLAFHSTNLHHTIPCTLCMCRMITFTKVWSVYFIVKQMITVHYWYNTNCKINRPSIDLGFWGLNLW